METKAETETETETETEMDALRVKRGPTVGPEVGTLEMKHSPG